MGRERDGYVLSSDSQRIDLHTVHAFLSQESYWAAGVPLSVMEKALRNSRCFGIYCATEQVAFGRLVTDYATFAYLADVFVVPAHRGRGLAKWLPDEITTDAELQGLRRWMLATADAHRLYEPYGFTALKAPARFMELHEPEIYER